jgi:hypothetical protein
LKHKINSAVSEINERKYNTEGENIGDEKYKNK